MNPYYEDDACTIYHGDCVDVLASLDPVDLVVTSPPYNLGDMSGGLANLDGGYDRCTDQRPDYDAWQTAVLSELWRLTAPSGAIFYNHKPIVRERTVSLPSRLVPPEAILRQVIILVPPHRRELVTDAFPARPRMDPFTRSSRLCLD